MDAMYRIKEIYCDAKKSTKSTRSSYIDISPEWKKLTVQTCPFELKGNKIEIHKIDFTSKIDEIDQITDKIDKHS